MAKKKVLRDPKTAGGFIEALVDVTGADKKEVRGFLEALTEVVTAELKEAGKAAIPILGVTVTVVDKPARKEREGRNPATGGTITIAAKPASKALKAKVQKRLKDSVIPIR